MAKKHFFVGLLVIFIVGSFSEVKGSGSDLYDLAKIRRGVKTKRISSFDRTGGNRDRIENIKPGRKQTIFDVAGAGVINHIWVTMGPKSVSRNDVILRMYWDGSEYPSVESPIGPFFGQGWDESYEFTSLLLSAPPVDGRSMVCYFAMPFADGARIEIENQADEEIAMFYYYIDYTQMKELPEDMGRFCAWYNQEVTETLPEGENQWKMFGPELANNKTGKGNYVILDVKGKGHFAGVNYYVHSPTPLWYGEGDDMIFIDGDEMPTLNGTGTEDLFNMAWCPKTVFSHPYFGCAKANENTGTCGRTHLYRFYVSDPIYFDKSLKFTIEHGVSNCLTLELCSVAYWYQQSPVAKLPPIPDKQARKLKKPIGGSMTFHRWRHAWRQSMGGGTTLWGDEQ